MASLNIPARIRRRLGLRGQRGAFLVETIIAFPVVVFLILSAIQLGLIYQAKLTLGYAAFEGAREGSLNNGMPIPIMMIKGLPVPNFVGGSVLNGLALGMMPLFNHGTGVLDLQKSYRVAELEMVTHSCIDYLQPYQSSFLDWGIVDRQGAEQNVWHIPNDTLRYRKPVGTELDDKTYAEGDKLLGPFSKISIQETNVLKIRVRYQYEPKMPVINKIIVGFVKALDSTPTPFAADAYRNGRIPLEAMSTVRMQSPLYWHPWYPLGNFPNGVADLDWSLEFNAQLLKLSTQLRPTGVVDLQDIRLSFCMNPLLIGGPNPVSLGGLGTNILRPTNEPSTKP